MRRARLIAGKQLRELALAGLLLAVPLLFLRANFRGQPETSLIDRLILRVCAPIQSEISDRLLRARQSWHQYVGLAGAARENQQLRKQLEQLQWRLRSAHNAEARLRRYERLLAFRRQRQFAAVGARVIGRFLAPQARGLRISVPELPTELKAGLAVVTPDGVVGRIGRTYSHYADVVLTVDPRSALDIKILPSGARGVLRGMRGSGRGALRIEYVSSSHKISVGDLVVTSGVAGSFPQIYLWARSLRSVAHRLQSTNGSSSRPPSMRRRSTSYSSSSRPSPRFSRRGR